MRPEPGQIVTVFRNRLRQDNLETYAEHAGRMDALARSMPGYVEHKTFVAEDGERVTIATFADRESQENWARNAEHRVAQRAGVESYYEQYSIAVGEVGRAHAWERGTLSS